MSVAQAQPAPPPEQTLTEEAALAALTLIAMSPSVPEPDMLAMVEALLTPLGIGADAARAAGMLAFGAVLLEPRQGAGPAYGFTARTAPARRAAYLLNAAKRIDAAHARVEPQMRAAESLHGVGDEVDAQKIRVRAAKDARFEETERRHLAQHLNAERARADAAERVDEQAAIYGGVLGWKARMDERTTKACRAAHGKNFNAGRPPTLPGVEEGERITGYPGMPHGGACRCVPAPPFAGAELLV